MDEVLRDQRYLVQRLGRAGPSASLAGVSPTATSTLGAAANGAAWADMSGSALREVARQLALLQQEVIAMQHAVFAAEHGRQIPSGC